MACQLGEIAAERFVTEFRDKGKATCKYLTLLDGKKRQKHVLERERKDMLGLDAGNSVSESLHACTKSMQKECGPNARIDRLAAVGQNRFNNDYGRVQQLVTGRKSQIEDSNQKELGEFHKLPAELQAPMVVAARKNSLK